MEGGARARARSATARARTEDGLAALRLLRVLAVHAIEAQLVFLPLRERPRQHVDAHLQEVLLEGEARLDRRAIHAEAVGAQQALLRRAVQVVHAALPRFPGGAARARRAADP